MHYRLATCHRVLGCRFRAQTLAVGEVRRFDRPDRCSQYGQLTASSTGCPSYPPDDPDSRNCAMQRFSSLCHQAR
jgi:hypothetical protein